MSDIAFVTSSAYRHLTDDDRLAADALADLGLTVVPAIWDDAAIDWTRFATIVVRSPWDYFLRVGEFAAWIDHMEAHRAPLWNPAPLLRWNMDKRYLRELAGSGVPVVETHWADAADDEPLAEVIRRHGWTRAVAKPVVSGGAHETWSLTSDDAAAHEERYRRLAATTGAMVQPFVEEIRAEGEWSLIFLGGAYSHAVRKRPAAGDFRVQAAHGGREHPAEAAPDLVAVAEQVLERVAHPWLYARVDLCRHAGAWSLMELEMLEPSLFLDTEAEAPERFARAIAETLGNARRAA